MSQKYRKAVYKCTTFRWSISKSIIWISTNHVVDFRLFFKVEGFFKKKKREKEDVNVVISHNRIGEDRYIAINI